MLKKWEKLVEKMRKAFALQKLLTFFQQKKYFHIWEINFWKFNETLTNDVVKFWTTGPRMAQFDWYRQELYK